MNLSRSVSIGPRSKNSTRLLLRPKEDQGSSEKNRWKHRKEFSKKNIAERLRPWQLQGELTSKGKPKYQNRLKERTLMFCRNRELRKSWKKS